MAEKDTDLEEASETDKENVRLNAKTLSWTGPRTVIVPRTDSGFGFTLRYFIVYPPESTLKESDLAEEDHDPDGHKRKKTKLSTLEPMVTIFVKQVKDGGPAYHAGLNTGDRIVSVNDETVTGKTYSHVISLIQASDCQLKLLVVPKDEDILQMAFQSAAYNQGRETHRGSALEIPNPPSTYSRFARMQSASYAALQNSADQNSFNKSPLSPRFKAELQVSNLSPEEFRINNEARTRTSLDSTRTLHSEVSPLRTHSSTGSLPAVGVTREPNQAAGDHRMVYIDNNVGGTERLLVTADSNRRSPKAKHRPSSHGPPSAPTRSSSKVITLSHIKNLDKANSMESISRSSDSSHSTKHSQDDSVQGILCQRHLQDNVDFSHDATSEDVKFRSSADNLLKSSASRHDAHTDAANRSSLYSSSSASSGNAYLQPSLMSKSMTTGKLPMTGLSGRVPQPYTRSHTTSALIQPTYIQEQQSSALRDYSGSTSPQPGTLTFPPPGLQLHSTSHPGHQGELVEHKPVYSVVSRPHDNNKEYYDQSHNSVHRYGRVFSSDYDFSSPQSAEGQGFYVNGRPVEYVDSHYTAPVFSSGSAYDRPSSTNITITTGRRDYGSNRANSSTTSLVSERIKRLENVDRDSIDSNSSSSSHGNGSSGRSSRGTRYVEQTGPTRASDSPSRSTAYTSSARSKPFDSVASRAAFFEQRQSSLDSMDGNTSSAPKRRISIEINPPLPQGSSSAALQRSMEPYNEETYRLKAEGPTSVSIYFRNPEPSHAKLPPSREIPYGSPIHFEHSPSPTHSYSDSHGHHVVTHVSQDIRDRSPVGLQQVVDENAEEQEYQRKRVAKRQASYLTAIHSPLNKSPPEDPFGSSSSSSSTLVSPPSGGNENLDPSSGSPGGAYYSSYNMQMPVMMEEEEDGAGGHMTTPSDNSSRGSLSSPPQPIVFRNKPTDERDVKLVRRTSYLMATCRDSTQMKLALNQQQQQQQPAATPVTASTAPTTQSEKSAYPTHPPPPSPVQLDLPHSQQDQEQPTTPTKNGSMKKLKAFFGERQRVHETPRIIEATQDKPKHSADMPSPIADVTKEGWLNCKIAVSDGKRASDRSWKPMWAVLRGHALYLHKEKSNANVMPSLLDEHPISIKSGSVDIAHNYTKKKHVFRLITFNGSEYLFQAEDQSPETMMAWIKAVQANKDPDDDKKEVASSDLILRKMTQSEHKLQVKNSPTSAIKVKEVKELKDTKKMMTRGLRARSPGSHSPAVKHRKADRDKDHVESPKNKDNKTWKGKMAKKFKRYGSSSAPSVDQEVDITGTFGISLEICVMSPTLEFVPLIVEVCTTVVEERGLEVVGIYRVPGNTAAVNALQEELNKEPDTINLEENERWLDVNVVGSLLKSFFRKLPEPMVTEELYDSFINANRQENPEKRMLLIKKLLHDLPEHHFETFHYLATHLNKVSIQGDLNKMDARNLAIVFGPTLIRKGDSMVTMVKDMSDQCRIVESVINHPDWFFSSWDVDSYVPVDEEVMDATPVSGMNQMLLSKAENLEYGISESPKGKDQKHREIVSSVIQAASKKVNRKKEKKVMMTSMSSIEMEAHSDSFQERNIDEEIAKSKGKLTSAQSQSTVTTSHSNKMVVKETKKSASTSALQSMAHSHSTDTVNEGTFSAKMLYLSRKDSDNSLVPTATRTCTSATVLNEPPPPEPEVKIKYYGKKNPVYPITPMPYTENSKPRMLRRYSEEMLRDRHDNSATAPQPESKVQLQQLNRSWGLAASTQEQLTRLQRETEKQKIEEEMMKTRLELEMEESVEELLAKPMETALPLPPETGGLPEYSLRVPGPDSTSLSSAYSSTSSTDYPAYDAKHPVYSESHYDGSRVHAEYPYEPKASSHGVHSTGSGAGSALPSGVQKYPYSSSSSSTLTTTATTSSTNTRNSGSSIRSATDSVDSAFDNCSGRYFQLVNAHHHHHHHPHPRRTPSHSSRDDLDIYTVHSVKYRTPPVAFDQYKVAGKGTVSRKKYDSRSEAARAKHEGSLESPSDFAYYTGSMQRRKGSLDSLLDLYDQHDHHSPSSSASDESELLTSLTSTFDQKLKVLLDPKTSPESAFPLDKTPSPGRMTTTLATAPSSVAEPKRRSSSQGAASQQGQIAEAAPSVGNTRKMSDSFFLERPFRDPSLHRLNSVKSDAKIGIASRFERKMEPEMESHSSVADSRYKQRALVCSTEQDEKASRPSHTTDSTGRSQPVSCGSIKQAEPKPAMSKMEKTDTNLSRQNRDAQSIDRGTVSGSDNSASRYCNMDKENSNMDPYSHVKHASLINPVSDRQKSNSPPIKRKDIVNLKTRRRHTVGGTNDLEHFKALCFVNNQTNKSSQPEQKLSAWDRLQPAVKETPAENQTLQSWMRRERLRTSSPDILSLGLSQAAPVIPITETLGRSEQPHTRQRRGTEGDLNDSLENWQEKNALSSNRRSSQSSLSGPASGFMFESAI